MSAVGEPPRSLAVPVLHVRTEDGRIFRFSRSFYIGREHDCDVRIEGVHVSRKHAAASYADGHWRLRDLKSGNGIFVDGQRVETASIDGTLTIRLGAAGPLLVLEAEPGARPANRPPATQQTGGETMLVASYAERYFTPGTADESVGRQTLMIRKAFQKVQRKQQRMYGGIVALVALAGLTAAAYAYYEHQQMIQLRSAAADVFYNMKSLDVQIATLELSVGTSGSRQSQEQVKAYMARRREWERTYDAYVSGLNRYDHRLTEQEKVILRVTRKFGECETAAPSDYLAEVSHYIGRWQATPRFANAVKRAQDLGYPRTIVEAFQKQDLPYQFFYLALQESDFQEATSGPLTRWGIAKGMWQFIPDTAKRYGLTVGPLVGFERPDPLDDRHHWEKATPAAARYIKDIYSTDAQASGLLVMASYNWGEQRVLRLIKTMPANPKERNFWKVLERHRDQVPSETYNYVLSIVSAAAIGENPRLFGFNFDNPLLFAEGQ